MKRIHFADLLILKVHLYNLRNALGPMCSYGKCYKCCNIESPNMSDEEGTAADTPEMIFCQITLKS